MHPNIQMVDLRGQYLKLKPQIDEAIANIINNTAFIGGKAVQDFTQVKKISRKISKKTLI